MQSIGPREAAEVSLRQILDGSLAFLGVVQLDGTLIEANALALSAGGLERQDVIGKKFWDCYWWSYDEAIQRQLQEAHRRVLAGEVVRYDVQVRMVHGTLMWIDFQLVPLRNAEGVITHLIPSGLDLTARKEAEAAVQKSEVKFRGVFENAFVGVALVGLDGKWLQVNDRICDLLGYERQELVTKTFQEITHPDDLENDLDYVAQLLAGQINNYKMDKRYVRKDGTAIWASLTVALQTGSLGEPLHFISIISDISERVAAQQHQRFLMSELSHRLKNQLAIIGAIVDQSIRGAADLNEFRDKFAGRIGALGRSIDLLMDQDRGKVPLSELVAQTLSPFPGRRVVHGGEVEVSGEVSETLALALHELATNATKYGAWSSRDGIVTLTWETTKEEGERRFLLRWVETGGPFVSKPVRAGFGLKITEGLAAQKLGANVTYEYPAEGVRWHLDMPATPEQIS